MAASASRLLSGLRGLIVDMDGVLWEGETPLPGMADFLSFLRAHSIRFVLATNNASLTPENYLRKLAGMGADVRREEILTSAMATAGYLKSIVRPGEKIFVLGEEGLLEAIREAGLEAADPEELHAAFVVCGMDRGLTWRKLGNAAINIRAGARFIGTNPDVTLPTERGITHGNGAILAALTAATGVRPTVIGKPFPTLYATALRAMGLPKARVAALGDRLETDILGARKAGLSSILVLTGVSSRSDARRSRIRPTLVIKDLPALQRAWRLSLGRGIG